MPRGRFTLASEPFESAMIVSQPALLYSRVVRSCRCPEIVTPNPATTSGPLGIVFEDCGLGPTPPTHTVDATKIPRRRHDLSWTPTMSVTTIDNPVATTLHEALQDYEVRVTRPEDLPQQQPQQHRQQSPPQDQQQPPIQQQRQVFWVPLTDHEPPAGIENPPGWPTDAERRGVPPYRPVNTRLDRSQRPNGTNGVETAFIATMFTGVWVKAVSSAAVVC